MLPSATRCVRCRIPFTETASTVSYFNSDEICTGCAEDEKGAPGYQAAKAAELASVQEGLRVMRAGGDYKPYYNYNHGLTDADRTYLGEAAQQRREQRQARSAGAA